MLSALLIPQDTSQEGQGACCQLALGQGTREAQLHCPATGWSSAGELRVLAGGPEPPCGVRLPLTGRAASLGKHGLPQRGPDPGSEGVGRAWVQPGEDQRLAWSTQCWAEGPRNLGSILEVADPQPQASYCIQPRPATSQGPAARHSAAPPAPTPALHRPHLLLQPRQSSASPTLSPWKPGWEGAGGGGGPPAAFGPLTGFH